jgi:hypothetical protein
VTTKILQYTILKQLSIFVHQSSIINTKYFIIKLDSGFDQILLFARELSHDKSRTNENESRKICSLGRSRFETEN